MNSETFVAEYWMTLSVTVFWALLESASRVVENVAISIVLKLPLYQFPCYLSFYDSSSNGYKTGLRFVQVHYFTDAFFGCVGEPWFKSLFPAFSVTRETAIRCLIL